MILLALLAVVLSGGGLVAVGFPDRPADKADVAFRACLAAALGLGTWSAAYAASLLLTGKAGPAKDLVLAAAGGALLWFGRARARAKASPPPLDPAPRRLWGLFAVACAACAAAFIEHTWRFPDGGWDAWMVWNLKARFLVRAADFRTAFSPDMLFWAHPDYPWLVPGAVAQGFLLAGRETSLVPQLLAAVFGTLVVAVATLGLARLRGWRWGVLGGLAVLTLPCFGTFASSQYSDVPLALFLTCSVALMALALERPDRSPRVLALAGFAAGLGVWTKNEGALYLACLAAGLLLRLRDARALAAFALGALPCAVLLAAFKLTLAPPNDLAHFSTPATLAAQALDAGRWGELLYQTLRRVVFFQVFALWMMAEVLVLLVWIRKLPGSAIGTALFLAAAACAPIYVLQPHPLQWVYRTSVDRIVIQLWPWAVLATLLPLATAATQARTTART